jgi:hypothetical protein
LISPWRRRAFEKTGDLSAGFVSEVMPQMLVLEPRDVEFAACDGFEQFLIVIIEEVETRIGALIIDDGARQLVEIPHSGTGIIHRGDELEVSTVGGGKDFVQGTEAVDGFFHGGPTHRRRAVAVFYLSVVLEEGNVVGCGFDAQDQGEFVVHLDRHLTHVVLDASAFDACVKVVPNLVLIVTVQFASEEGGYVLRFDGMDGRSGQTAVD